MTVGADYRRHSMFGDPGGLVCDFCKTPMPQCRAGIRVCHGDCWICRESQARRVVEEARGKRIVRLLVAGILVLCGGMAAVGYRANRFEVEARKAAGQE